MRFFVLASNILIVEDTSYAGIHHSKYWMPIHYDTIEDGQNKKSHLLFSKSKSVDWAQDASNVARLCKIISVAFAHTQIQHLATQASL